MWTLVVFDCPWVRQAVPTNPRKRPTWHPSVRTDFMRLGSVTTNRKNGYTGEQHGVGTDSGSVSTGPSRMLSVLTEGCHTCGLFPWVRRYGLLYLRRVEYDQWFVTPMICVAVIFSSNILHLVCTKDCTKDCHLAYDILEMHFHECKPLYFYSHLIFLKESSYKLLSIVSSNSLTPMSWQANA